MIMKLKTYLISSNFLSFMIGFISGFLVFFFILFGSYFSSFADELDLNDSEVVDVFSPDDSFDLQSDSEIIEQPDLFDEVDSSLDLPDPDLDDLDLQSKIDFYENNLSDHSISAFKDEYINSEDLTDIDIADYFKSVVTQALFDIFGDPQLFDDEDDEYYDFETADDGDFMSSFRALTFNRSGYQNVVVYHGMFNGSNCDLIIPYSEYSKLLNQNGYLVNVGSSSVTGKLLYNDAPLNPNDYDSYVYVLNPIYGSTSNVWQYGSFNYRRHYYLTSSGTTQRITSTDLYGSFRIDDVDVYYSNSERTYYVGLIILLFMGVNFLWHRRH